MNRPYITSLFFFKFLISFLCICYYANPLLAQNADTTEFITYYYESGSKSSEGTLREGKPDAYWKSYYRNGKLKTEGNRVNFELDGEWKFYNEEGELTLSIEYKQGKKDGLRKTYLDSIVVKSEVFEKDMRNGMLQEFDQKGRLQQEIPFVEDLEQGQGYIYDSLMSVQTLLSYKSGVLVRNQPINRKDRLERKQGTWIEFHKNMNIKVEGTYRNDLKNGYWKFYKISGDLIRTEYWIDGVLQEDKGKTEKIEIRKEIHPETGALKYVGSYLNGKKNGVQREYDKEGNITKSYVYASGQILEEGGYIDEQGRKQGHWKSFYQDGKLKHEGDYKDGLRTGPWLYYYADGKVEQKGRFRFDEPEGSWMWYYPDGSTWKEEEYIDGLEDGMSIEYDTAGTVLAQGEFIEGLREGIWFFDVGDHREEGKYFEGSRIGEWVHTYTDIDQIQFKGSYENGKEDGTHIFYYPNGQVKKRGEYSFGDKLGIWEFFTQSGQRYLTIEYNKSGEEIRYNGVKIKDGRRR